MLEFNHMYYIKKHVRKYHLIFFFCNFIKDFFFFSGVLYERSCSTKEAAQPLFDNVTGLVYRRYFFMISEKFFKSYSLKHLCTGVFLWILRNF